MSTLKVNEVRHLSNTGSANIVLESNATTNLQATSTLGLTVTGTLTVSGVSTLNGNVVIGNASTDTVNLISTIKGFNNFSGFTGEVRMYAGNAAGNAPPAGWLYCNGDTISSLSGNGGTHYNADGKGNDYQPLFNLLKASDDWSNSNSATWGTNTVKTPDFRSRAPVGNNTGAATTITAGLTSRTLSDVAGTETHALVIAELASHTHVMTNPVSATGQTATHSHTHTVPSGTSGSTDPGDTNATDPGDTNTAGSHNHTLYHSTHSGNEQNTGLGAGWSGTWGQAYTSSQNINAAGDHTHTMPTHTHTMPSHTHTTPGSTTSAISTATVTLGGETHSHTSSAASTGSGTAHTILQPIISVNYIIKV
jgi:microcystin-dependent protein